MGTVACAEASCATASFCRISLLEACSSAFWFWSAAMVLRASVSSDMISGLGPTVFAASLMARSLLPSSCACFFLSSSNLAAASSACSPMRLIRHSRASRSVRESALAWASCSSKCTLACASRAFMSSTRRSALSTAALHRSLSWLMMSTSSCSRRLRSWKSTSSLSLRVFSTCSALCPNSSVLMCSRRCSRRGPMVMIMLVRAEPPNESLSMRVSLVSR
mmetsp:Transcript_27410/g.87835  ORF Transcript_27410/g.87835 Transcript_27410/m.87835 type:complete len:220 (+) Transcript_27410:919-1578(+)